MRFLILVSILVAAAAYAVDQAPVDAVVEILKKLEADPAGQDALKNGLEAQSGELSGELATLEAELKRLKNELAAQEAARDTASDRIATIERVTAALRALGTPGEAVKVDSAADEHFEKTIRPILSARCLNCHGPEKQKGGLRLDSRDAMLKGGETGAAVLPGNAGASALVHALAYTDDPKMPPDGKLPQEEIDALTAWIQAGAHWPAYDAAPPVAPTAKASGIDIEKGRDWWAFKPVAAQTPPTVQDASWPRSPIDQFLLARLESEGLAPAAPADKRTLIRRVTFDLTGLPPTPADVEAFLADDTPEAFAKVVDRLLDTPQYGERWARHWLDVMRYTDSFDSRGTAATDPTEIYKYRDWVVKAFNDDMPFDRFVRYQIAGDIIAAQQPVFDPEGIIATGALAIGNWPQGDADKQKMLTDIVDDQIDLVCRGFMAATMGCARCHDHKFDPFLTRDYYGLAGMFFSSHILPGPGQKTEGSPILFIPLMEKDKLDEINQRNARIAELDKQTGDMLNARRTAFAKSQLPETARYLSAANTFANLPAPRDAAAFAAENSLNVEALNNWLSYLGLADFNLMKRLTTGLGGVPDLSALNGAGDTPSFSVNSANAPAKYLNIMFEPRSIALHPGPTTPIAVAWKSPVSGTVLIDAIITDIDASCGDGAAWRIDKRAAGTSQIAEGAFDNGGMSVYKDAPPQDVAQGDYLMLYILPKSGHACDSTRVSLEISEEGGDRRTWNLTEDALRAPLSEASNPFPDGYGNAAVWSVIDAADAPAPEAGSPLAAWQSARASGDAAALEAAGKAFQEALIADAAAETPGPLAMEFLSSKGPFYTANPPFTASDAEPADPLPAMQEELAALRAVPVPSIPMANGIQEGGTPNTEHEGIHDVKIHQRGDYNRLGDVAPRAMPAVLLSGEQQPIASGSGRRELADFVASPSNPLTARVMVNRIWQHHFGEGIVRTPGNFGTRGELPDHPELLDFLAKAFVDSGWSIKAMHRMMLNTAAYQQASTPSAAAREQDPENRLLSHMNRLRIEAEALRDAMLAVAGHLDTTVGGPAFRELDSPRRTIYFRTVRSDRTTYNMLFDAADPTSIIDKRNNAIVAPQALFLMNNPFVLTQAAALASRIPPTEPLDGAVTQLYALLFAREPSQEEISIARDLVAQFPAETAWSTYCQTLLATNEFTYLD